jgi:nicotinamidase-related amidase
MTSSGSIWPCSAPADGTAIAVVVIDMQVDFCKPGGWIDQLGENVGNTQRVIEPIGRLLDFARAAGLAIVHTREGHDPELSDLHPNKQWRTRVHGLGIGDRGATGRILVRGEPGWEIVPELAPLAGEMVIDKPGKSAFHATDLERQLTARGVTHLAVCGVTSDCCVQSTVRDAYERGFECILLEDCTAAVETANHTATLEILGAYGGRWCKVMTAAAFRAGLSPAHA